MFFILFLSKLSQSESTNKTEYDKKTGEQHQTSNIGSELIDEEGKVKSCLDLTELNNIIDQHPEVFKEFSDKLENNTYN